MPKQINVGVNGAVKTVKEVPLCINGVIKKAIKGVCGVNGAVREFFAMSDYEQIQNYSLIYDRGTEYVGLSIYAEDPNYGGICSKESSYIHIGRESTTYSNWTGGMITTNSTVSLSGYTTASVLLNSKSYVTINDTNEGYESAAIVAKWSGFGSASDPNAIWQPGFEAYASCGFGGRQYGCHIDVSSLTSSLYMKFTIRGELNNIYDYYVTGMVLSKSDDITTLASKAGIATATVANILNNSSTLLNNYDAVQWMIKRCTGDFMVRAVTNPTFLSALNSSPFKSYITGNTHWAKFLAMTA